MHEPSFRPNPRLFPFESKWFASRVGRVHYIDEGTGPTILLLHGNPTWSFLYRGIVLRLRESFRCIALDYPGFGMSVRPDDYGYTPAEHAAITRDLVANLELQDLTIMGQDWGGPIGMKVAVDLGSRVRALVMGNTWYWPLDAWHMTVFGSLMSTGLMQRQILRNNLFVDHIMPLSVKHRMAPEVMDHYRGPQATPLDRVGAAEFPRQLSRAEDWLRELNADVVDSLTRIPMLLTWGIHDLAFTPAFMDRFRADFDQTSVTRLSAKHYIQEDAPAEISDAIRRFLS